MIKILVTNGGGLLGEAIKVERKSIHVNDYVEWCFLKHDECDLTSYFNVDDLFSTFKPSIVIHLADHEQGHDKCHGKGHDKGPEAQAKGSNNVLFLTKSTMINSNILVACEKYNVERLINIFNTDIFSLKNTSYPLTSNQIMDGEPQCNAISTRWLYSGSKLLSHKLKVINLIHSELYGINDYYNLLKSGIIPGIIFRCFLAKKNKQNLFIKGSGNCYKQFVLANDFAKIIIKFIKLPLKVDFNNIIVSPPINTEITIKELIFTITDIMNFEKLIVFENKDDEQLKKTCDNSELLQYIDFKFTDLNKGLKKTITHFLAHYKKI